jgi:hypothetical protein
LPYFQRLNPPKGLAGGYVELLDAIDICTARAAQATTPAERTFFLAKREEVRRALDKMWKEYDALSTAAAAHADQAIVRRIRATAVRGRTSGRMEAGVVSHALTTTWPAGAIGIADIDILNATAINPQYQSAGTYWRTQEYGYAGHVGRIVPGFFQPGQSRPSAAEFRNYPYFEQVDCNALARILRSRPGGYWHGQSGTR